MCDYEKKCSDYIIQSSLQPLAHKPLPGQLVAAPYQDGDECYYRARIEEISSQRVPGAKGHVANISKALVSLFVGGGGGGGVGLLFILKVKGKISPAEY